MNLKLWLIEIPQKFIIGFIILNFLAMLAYPGGILHNSETAGYSFTNNFLSDLGRFISWSGEQNFYSNLFFNGGMIITGLMLSIFFINLRTIFPANNKTIYFLSILGTLSGIAGGYSMVGVGLTPADLYFDAHLLCAHWIFRFFLIAAFCYMIIILKTDLIDNKYAIGYCLFALLIFLYIMISEFGPNARDNMLALTVQVVAQKSILLCFLVTIYIQTKGLAKILN
tara:strand:- start:1291 stop:1968 length:678 start_codon:yes stop_codon:yes gene_type:complete